MPLPIDIPGTLAQSWTELMQLLAAQGYDVIAIEQGAVQITTQQELIEYLKQFGIEPVYTISETLSGFAQVSAVDPANTTAVTVGTGTAVTVAQGAAQDFTMNGGTTWGIVKKGIAITAALALMISALDATLITDLFRDQLDEAATPFTIDGENIPVQISSDGKTYYNVDFLEAIREKLIDLGAFNTGGIVFPETIPTAVSFTQAAYVSDIPTPDTVTVYPNVYDPQSDYVHQYTRFAYSATSSQFPGETLYLDIARIVYDGGEIDVPIKNVFMIWDQTNKGVMFVELPEYERIATYTKITSVKVFDRNHTGIYDSLFSISTRDIVKIYRHNDNHVVGFGAIANFLPSGSYALNGSPATYPGTLYDYNSLILHVLLGEEEPAIEGVQPKESVLINGISDLTKQIYEVIPEWGTPVQTATPTDEDLTEQTDWYPVSTNDVDGLTDGLTEEQTENATDGEPDEDIRDDIIDRLQEILDILLRDPDNPDEPVIPVIEVGDSGDTPPAEPPLLSGSSNGLWAIYNPSLQQVHDFGAWLWSDNIIDSIKRQFSNSPIDAVIGFHMIYCTPITGSQKTIKAGYLDSPVQAAEVTNQYAEIDCGTVTVTEFYGNAIDYMKTRIALYLPFIGIVPLDAGVVMGSTLSLKYRIDVLTGTCLAQVKVIKENSSAVIYTYQGNCSVQIPLTGATYTGMVGALLGGVTAGISVMTGNLAGAAAGVKGAISSLSQGHNIQHSGTIGSNAGALGIRVPYVIVTHPVQRMPVNYAAIEGIPSNYAVRIGECSGYTRIISGHMENITGATADELQMIRDALMEGIII